MTEQLKDIPRFRRERDAALLTGDIFEVRRFASRWFTLPPMQSVRSETAAMHKAIVAATTLPVEYRMRSRAWLTSNGFEVPRAAPKPIRGVLR
jgi:hypothetical protein